MAVLLDPKWKNEFMIKLSWDKSEVNVWCPVCRKSVQDLLHTSFVSLERSIDEHMKVPHDEQEISLAEFD